MPPAETGMIQTNPPISNAMTSFPPPADSLPASTPEERPASGPNRLDRAITASQEFFFRQQLPEGYWWAELESNVTITAEYLMLFHILGTVDRERERKIVNYLLSKQTADGFWTIYYGGPGDLST